MSLILYFHGTVLIKPLKPGSTPLYILVASALARCLLEMQTLWLHPDLLNRNRQFNKILRLYLRILVFGVTDTQQTLF
jgi:hypothetical protein